MSRCRSSNFVFFFFFLDWNAKQVHIPNLSTIFEIQHLNHDQSWSLIPYLIFQLHNKIEFMIRNVNCVHGATTLIINIISNWADETKNHQIMFICFCSSFDIHLHMSCFVISFFFFLFYTNQISCTHLPISNFLFFILCITWLFYIFADSVWQTTNKFITNSSTA